MQATSTKLSTALDVHFEEIASHAHRAFASLLLGLVWGLGTSFAAMSASSVLVLGATLVLCLLVAECFYGSTICALLGSKLGVLMILYGMSALVSSLLNGVDLVHLLRYLAIVPSAGIFLAASRAGASNLKGIRLGLTLGVCALILFHVAHVSFGQLADPHYRMFLFLNPNGVAFNAAVGGISLLDYLLDRHRHLGFRVLSAVLLVAVIIVILATKSRTATVGFIVGGAAVSWIRMSRKTWIVGAVTVLTLLVWGSSLALDEAAVRDVYRMNGTPLTLEIRMHTWAALVENGWIQSPIIGQGPGASERMAERYTGVSGPHSAYVQVLSELGLLGFMPLAIILGVAVVRSVGKGRYEDSAFPIGCLFCGIVGGIAESRLLNSGSPGSLFLVLAVLLLWEREPSENGLSNQNELS